MKIRSILLFAGLVVATGVGTPLSADTKDCGHNSTISYTDPWAAGGVVNDCWCKKDCTVWTGCMDTIQEWCSNCLSAPECDTSGGSDPDGTGYHPPIKRKYA